MYVLNRLLIRMAVNKELVLHLLVGAPNDGHLKLAGRDLSDRELEPGVGAGSRESVSKEKVNRNVARSSLSCNS